jgi:hypothetical protein
MPIHNESPRRKRTGYLKDHNKYLKLRRWDEIFMNNFTADYTFDRRGLSCPMPLLKTYKTLATMTSGEVLELSKRATAILHSKRAAFHGKYYALRRVGAKSRRCRGRFPGCVGFGCGELLRASVRSRRDCEYDQLIDLIFEYDQIITWW